LVLFMNPTTLFGTIHESHCTIQLTFNLFSYTYSKKFSILAK